MCIGNSRSRSLELLVCNFIILVTCLNSDLSIKVFKLDLNHKENKMDLLYQIFSNSLKASRIRFPEKFLE